ncbi:MAG: alanine racemase [Bacteroidota bacterium]
MVDVNQIISPTLLLDEQRCRKNIANMAERASQHGVQLAPHFKTHQSAQVGAWFQEYGVKAITVTSVKMASYFAQHGWEDITIAFPVNIREIEAINHLASRVRLTVFVNSVESAQFLTSRMSADLYFYVEIDTGYHRSGVWHESITQIQQILDRANSNYLHFVGFYTHAGHTYGARSVDEVAAIHQDTVAKLKQLKSAFFSDFPRLKLSLGDTPACSLATDFSEIDIIRPGNFVFYDATQHLIGSNSIGEIAICLAVPVVALHPQRNEVITHCGWTYLGKDSLPDEEKGEWYGLVVELSSTGWSAPIEEAYVHKLSQEHGVIHLPDEQFSKLEVGDLLGILPVHSCATVVMMGEAVTLNGQVIEMM